MGVDSGTSLLAGPQEDVNAIMHKLGATSAQGLFTVPSDKLDSLPPLTFKLGGGAGSAFALTMREIVLGCQDNLCYLGIQPSPAPLWILGDVFMRVYYVKFDYDNQKIGIARAASSSSGGSIVVV